MTATNAAHAEPRTTIAPSEESPSAQPERFLTAREIAELLSVHENYIYELATRAMIPSYKIGGNRRFRWSEIEIWLSRQRTAPKSAPRTDIVVR